MERPGLGLLRDLVFAGVRCGARLRLVTFDYLRITREAAALCRLLDWMDEWAPSRRAWSRWDEVGSAVSFHPPK